MRVLRLRTSTPINELKGEQFWVADAHTKLSMLPCGHFVISRFDKHVLIPHGRVDSCAVEPDVEPLRIKTVHGDIEIVPEEPPVRRKPGRPPSQ